MLCVEVGICYCFGLQRTEGIDQFALCEQPVEIFSLPSVIATRVPFTRWIERVQIGMDDIQVAAYNRGGCQALDKLYNPVVPFLTQLDSARCLGSEYGT